MPVEQSEDRQTERPVCLANAHDSLIRIIENPKNHVDGWTPIDRIQTRLPREHGYTVKDIRACLSGCLASHVEMRADQHGTATHARRTDATYRYTPAPTLLPHDKHVAQRKAWEKTINDLAVYPNEPARDDLRRRMAAASIDPRPEWMDEYEEALEAGLMVSRFGSLLTATQKQLEVMVETRTTEVEVDLLEEVTLDLYRVLWSLHGGANPLAPKKTPPANVVTRDDIMKAASSHGGGASQGEKDAFAAKVQEALAAEDRQTETPVCLAPEPKAEPEPAPAVAEQLAAPAEAPVEVAAPVDGLDEPTAEETI